MKQLVFLYWGCAFLMYLSQVYYPCGSLAGRIEDKAARLRSRYMDIFMVAAIAWMTCFSFLRTSYNDSPLSSKKQKNNCRQRHPGSGCPFFNSFQGICSLAAA